MNPDENRQKRINRILDLYLSRVAPNDAASAELGNSVREWFMEDSHLPEKYAALEEAFEKYVDYRSRPSAEAVASWLGVMNKLGLPVNDELLARLTKPYTRTALLRRLALRAAAVLLPVLLAAGAYLWHSSLRPEMIAETVPAGVPMRLLQLPDGTGVWLKSGSRLEYPARFGRQRRTALTGEAFFDVAHDPRHPFVVKTEELAVYVTGTEFNVCAWPDGTSTEVTLHSGSVKVRSDGAWTDMEPGSRFDHDRLTGANITREVDLDRSDWRKSELKYTDVTLGEIFSGIASVYGVAFEFNTTLSGERYMVSFPMGEGLQQVMSILKSYTGEFDFEIVPGKVIINKQSE